MQQVAPSVAVRLWEAACPLSFLAVTASPASARPCQAPYPRGHWELEAWSSSVLPFSHVTAMYKMWGYVKQRVMLTVSVTGCVRGNGCDLLAPCIPSFNSYNDPEGRIPFYR